MALELQGRAAVISGAAGGIGRALATEAARRGMVVHGWDVAEPRDTLPPTEGVIRSSCVDVSNFDEVAAAAQEVLAEGREVGLVFANAGLLRVGRSWEISAADWTKLLAVNIGGVAAMLRAFVPALLAQPGGSRIVLTGSQSAFVPRPGNSAYSATKHAIWGLAEALKLELAQAGDKVGVSLLAPGPVRTGLADQAGQKAFSDALREIGMPPAEIAAATFAAIAQDRFWVLPHDGFKPELEERVARIVAEEAPR